MAENSEDERREAHDEEVNERHLARMYGELDEGHDSDDGKNDDLIDDDKVFGVVSWNSFHHDMDEDTLAEQDIKKYGQCRGCGNVLYPDIVSHHKVRTFELSSEGWEGSKMLFRRSCCEHCFSDLRWDGWVDLNSLTSQNPLDIPELPFSSTEYHDYTVNDQGEWARKDDLEMPHDYDEMLEAFKQSIRDHHEKETVNVSQ